MLRESIAILVLELLMVLILVRSKHPGYALSILPLAILPGAHLLVLLVQRLMGETVFGVRTAAIRGFVDMLAVVGSVLAIVLISRKIDSAKNRKLYLLALIIYTVLLGWIFIWNSLQMIIV